MLRLDKLICHQTGLTRTEAKKQIRSGAVMVNGETEKSADRKINPENDEILVSGHALNYKKCTYIMMNKPAGVVSATEDGRDNTVIDLVPENLAARGLFPAGRLDKDTTGLLILTNDGDFAHKITAPKSEIEKVYKASLESPLDQAAHARLRAGITLSDKTVCRPAGVKIGDSDTELILSIHEGKYHQVKRMIAAAGGKVTALCRLSIGGLALDDTLSEGDCRPLTEQEKRLICPALCNNDNEF